MSKLLLVIDVQKDFINKNTKPILSKIEELVNNCQFENIAFTMLASEKQNEYFFLK